MLICSGVFVNTAMAFEIQTDSVPEKLVVSNVVIMGNKTTKTWVIERELSFAPGDSLTAFELNNAIIISKNNLNNTSLFNTVDIHYVLGSSKNIEVFILVNERWYVWPNVIFELAETNFNSWWENKDFSRINYGVSLSHKNFRGRNEEVNIHAQFGFTERIALSFNTPYLNKRKTLGFGFKVAYSQNHEVNYTSLDNRRVFYKDVAEVQQQEIKTAVNFRYRKKFYSTHMIEAWHEEVGISDSVSALNPDYLLGDKNRQQFIGISYRYLMDQRDNKIYALTGTYLDAGLNKLGLGLLDSEVDLWWSKIEVKKYWALGKKTYLAAMARGQFFLNERQPYYLSDGLGYTDKSTIRSYELYVIDAQQMAISKIQFRYQLKSAKPRDLPLMPFQKFRKFYYSVYLGVFSDAGYAWDSYHYPLNQMANDIQYGSGISLDVTSVYDLVFRAEYSMNKFGEHRLFLHFVAPI